MMHREDRMSKCIVMALASILIISTVVMNVSA